MGRDSVWWKGGGAEGRRVAHADCVTYTTGL